MLRDKKWCQEDGLMLKEGKVYVPKDEKLRAEVIRLHHDTPVGEHRRQLKDSRIGDKEFLVARGVTREVKLYVEGYDTYQCKQKLNTTAGRKTYTKFDFRQRRCGLTLVQILLQSCL